MPAPSDLSARIDDAISRLVSPRIFTSRAPLAAHVFQSAEPVPYQHALRAAYQPVQLGWKWGPVWSNAWFRLSGRVPREMDAQEIFLRFSSGTEALLWKDGVPVHGLDINHDLAQVHARPGEDLTLYVEAACNRPLGATTFFFDNAAEVERWKEPLPGRFELCELVTFDRAALRLSHTLHFASRLLAHSASDALAARLAPIIDSLGRAGWGQRSSRNSNPTSAAP